LVLGLVLVLLLFSTLLPWRAPPCCRPGSADFHHQKGETGRELVFVLCFFFSRIVQPWQVVFSKQKYALTQSNHQLTFFFVEGDAAYL
jgi:hypothetical protein